MKLPRWVPTWFYRNKKPLPGGPFYIGQYTGRLQEWCHSCGKGHDAPAKENCPKEKTE